MGLKGIFSVFQLIFFLIEFYVLSTVEYTNKSKQAIFNGLIIPAVGEVDTTFIAIIPKFLFELHIKNVHFSKE